MVRDGVWGGWGGGSMNASHRLRLLTELAQEFAAATSDYQRLLDLVTRRMGELLGEMCSIRFLDETREWLETTGSIYHPDPELSRAVADFLLTQPQRVISSAVATSGSRARLAAATRRSRVIDRVIGRLIGTPPRRAAGARPRGPPPRPARPPGSPGSRLALRAAPTRPTNHHAPFLPRR
jgi:hypothetical protein